MHIGIIFFGLIGFLILVIVLAIVTSEEDFTVMT